MSLMKTLDQTVKVERVLRNPECSRCKRLCEYAQTICNPGSGPWSADIMLVGEAPGETEDNGGEPFIGRAGRFMDKRLLLASGIDRENIRIENAVRCRPPKNDTPTIREISNCREYLEAAIDRVKPKVVLLLGNAPLASALYFEYKKKEKQGESKMSGISKWRGKMIWHRNWNCWVIPTYHPSYLSRQWNQGSDFYYHMGLSDFELANKLAHQFRPDVQDPEIVIVQDEDAVRGMLQDIENSSAYSFDIETGGTGNSSERYLLGFSLAKNTEKGYYADWAVFRENRLLRERLERLLLSKRKLIMHNGAYEQRILACSEGLAVKGNYFDTMIAAKMLDENFPVGLKDRAWIDTYYGGYDVELEKYKRSIKMKDDDPDYSKIPFELLSWYGAFDSVVTFALYEEYLTRLEEEELLPLFEKVSMPVRKVMSKAEINGFRVDLDRAHEIKKKGEEAFNTLEERIYEEVGGRFNINSGPQLQKILFKKLKYKPLKATKTGYSTDRDTLKYLAGQKKGTHIAQWLSDRSYIKTMLGTHVSQAIKSVWADGRIHTQYNLTGTVTGRTSSSDPGIHNVPSDGLIRSLYIAGPGRKIVEADLKTAELAYLAAESGEETFLRAFAEGTDLHNETYRTVFDKPSDYMPTQDERRIAKSINFGLVYGMTAYGLAVRLGIDQDEAQEFIDQYFSRLPRVAEYMRRLQEEAKELGYVSSLFKRKRRLPLAESDIEYEQNRALRQAMNAPIQSGASDYTYIGLVRLDRALVKSSYDSLIVHTVHDCAITDTAEEHAEPVAELIKESFETPVKIIPVRMRVDVEIHDRWGEGNDSRLADIFESLGIAV